MHIDLISFECLTVFHPVDSRFIELMVIRDLTLEVGCTVLSNGQISRGEGDYCLACSVVVGGMGGRERPQVSFFHVYCHLVLVIPVCLAHYCIFTVSITLLYYL